jgi:hypothetical protein
VAVLLVGGAASFVATRVRAVPRRASTASTFASVASEQAAEAAARASTDPHEAPAAQPAEPGPDDDVEPATVEAQRARLFARMQQELGVTGAALEKVEAIFAASPVLSQGNPAVARHPMKRSECRRIRAEAGLSPAHVPACGAPNMVPVYDVEGGKTAAEAPICVDQFEFPDIPCEYPVVHVRAREASLICDALGKRLCDAHEWEGACAGSLRAPDVEYRWGWPRLQASYAHNVKRVKVWSYGPTKNHALCATGSTRTPGCNGGGWRSCGSNTYPTGAFPACQSSFGVFDMNGNAAEHMSLPAGPEDLGTGDGLTEMKGSWFVFSTIEAHEDDCRFRAPAWHETRVMNEQSHMNYHLGFRCCKDVEQSASSAD